MPSISEQLISEIHPELFHYTSEVGLSGILQSQYLRATHWQYLNDGEELVHLHETLISLIQPDLLEHAKHANQRAAHSEEFRTFLSSVGGIEGLSRTWSRQIADLMRESLLQGNREEHIFDFFITSFCTPEHDYPGVREHGLLSQWRSYGRDGGYAIVFDTAKLEELMKTDATLWSCRLGLGEVGYSSDPPDVLFQRLEALPQLKIAAINFATNPTEKSASELLNPFLDCSTRFKHWAFREEREVRLVVTLNGPRMQQENASAGVPFTERTRYSFDRSGTTVPCINLFEGIETSGSLRLPIRRIIVGPGRSQLDQEDKLSKMLKKCGYSIPVTRSGIPLRF